MLAVVDDARTVQQQSGSDSPAMGVFMALIRGIVAGQARVAHERFS
jgi:hypothetical protein